MPSTRVQARVVRRAAEDALGARRDAVSALAVASVTIATGSMTAPLAASRRSSGYLPTLDGWRAIAILVVVASHAVRGRCLANDVTACGIGALGAHGVGIFFAISGFLITTRLIEELQRGGLSYRRFYIRRAFRILPPAVAYLLVLALVAAAGWVTVVPKYWLAALAFYRNYVPVNPDIEWYTAHYWSLAIEEHFYLFWPVLLGTVGLRRGARTAIGLALAVGAWRRLDWHFHWFERAFGLPSIYMLNRSDARLDALLYGCALALLLQRADVRRRLTAWLTTPVVVLGAAVVAGAIAWAPPATVVFLEAAIVPFLVVGTVLRPTTLLGRWLERPWMRWIGRLSYSLYLWQQLWAPQQAESPASAAWQIPLRVALAFACAAASYYLLERPMIKVGHRLAPPATPGRIDLDETPASMPERASPPVREIA